MKSRVKCAPITCPHCGRKSGWGKSVAGLKSHILRCQVTLADVLAVRTDRTGSCWLWTGAKHGDGYGLILFKGKHYRAHRAAWEAANGEPPPADMSVMHTCDNPACVNPAHLRLGTHTENMHDMQRKGRGRGKAKLTPDQVREIRRDFRVYGRKKNNLAEIAARYPGITRAGVYQAASGRSWRNLK